MHINHSLPLLILLLNSCNTQIPKAYTECGEKVKIYPDYTEVMIPANITPLNFRIDDIAEKAIVRIANCNGEEFLVESGNDLEITISQKKWQKLLEESKGGSISYNVFLKKDNQWVHYAPFNQEVSKDSIDSYLTYRLIEPSYMESGHMGIYQFNLENGEEKAIFTNHRERIEGKYTTQKCVNCHTAQRNHPENKMFYYRSANGGLILTYNGETKKINTRCGDMFAGTVYPAWHPTKPLIAFSCNNIKQTFQSYDKCKIDAFDLYSDLVLYNTEKNTISSIRKTNTKQETNPCWSGNGEYLYFNSTDSILSKVNDPRKMLYNIYRIKYNQAENKWGEDELIYEAAKKNKSATYPKVSPDNRFLLITESDYGTSTQTNKTADLYLIDLKDNSARPLNEVNCPTESDSYHDWSSNSRWIVFCSRREDGNYARAYFSHINEEGKASKPFILPRSSSHYHEDLLKNYNVTEFSTMPISNSMADIQNTIEKETIQAEFEGEYDPNYIDAYTSATKN